MLRNLKVRESIQRLVRRTWQFFTGVVVAVVAFYGLFFDLKRPDVAAEITAVETTSSDPIDVARVPDLAGLREVMDGPFEGRSAEPGFTVDQIDRRLLIMADYSVRERNELDRQERDLNSLVARNNKGSQETALAELEKEMQDPFSPATEATPAKGATPQERSEANIRSIRKLLDSKRKDHAKRSAKIKDAEKQWQEYKASVLPNRARLEVTCAVSNRGAGATSLRPQALLRADLGEGNYLDLQMKLSGYGGSADLATLQTRSCKIVRFQSEEVQSMSPADRQRFKTFLGNVSPARLFIVDVRGKTYPSNSVPFSQGVYEQKVYDSLKQYASRRGEI